MFFTSLESSDATIAYLQKLLARTFLVPERSLPRILFHGVILASIISSFWLLDSLKDPVLSEIVGIEYQPVAKFFSVFTTLVIVVFYDKLTNLVTKQNLFHILSVIFGTFFLIYSALLSHPVAGISNFHKGPHRALGWCIYFTVEGYGSLMVTLFWSFTNSVMDLEEAMGAYGLIIAIAQIGAIFGSTLATNSIHWGIPNLFLFGAVLIYLNSHLIKTYFIVYKKETNYIFHENSLSDKSSDIDSDEEDLEYNNNLNNNSQKQIHQFEISSSGTTTKSSRSFSNLYQSFKEYVAKEFAKFLTHFGSGLNLIIQYPYMLKLLGVSCLYEIVITVLDYQFKILGAQVTAAEAAEAASKAANHVGSIATTIAFDVVSELSQNGEQPYNEEFSFQEDHYFVPHNTTISIEDYTQDASDRFATLLGHFGQLTNVISFLLSFFGFSLIVHKYGIKISLMIFPITLLISIIVSYFYSYLFVYFFFISLLKGMIFSLHDPVKELLYIPTDNNIKFTAKAWIDVFGSRLAKSLGSLFINVIFYNKNSTSSIDIIKLKNIFIIPSIIICLVLLFLTILIGNEFNYLIDNNKIIGDEKNYTNTSNFYNNGASRKFSDYGLDDNGLMPGEIGYSGYSNELFEGIDFNVLNTSNDKNNNQISSSSSRNSLNSIDEEISREYGINSDKKSRDFVENPMKSPEKN